MALVEWRPVSAELQELQAVCYRCRQWRPLPECVEWHNVLALWQCYVCIDCLSDPLEEAAMRAYGWSRA